VPVVFIERAGLPASRCRDFFPPTSLFFFDRYFDANLGFPFFPRLSEKRKTRLGLFRVYFLFFEKLSDLPFPSIVPFSYAVVFFFFFWKIFVFLAYG